MVSIGMRKGRTGIPGLWTQVLDAGLWRLGSGHLDTIVDWFRTKLEPSF